MGIASGTTPYLARSGVPGDDARGMRLTEFLRHFVLAAAAADRRFARTQDARDIHAGIAVWESLVDGGGLGESEPEALVDAQLAASMLYARRFEVRRREADLSLARRHLEDAREHVQPGSLADLQVRMSEAAWRMLRFQADGPPEDLDQAIEIWTGLIVTDAGTLAAANLGRALLARHALAGDPDDLHAGRSLLGLATAEMPADHPARPDIELALKAAG
jgi:hypothetical protein